MVPSAAGRSDPPRNGNGPIGNDAARRLRFDDQAGTDELGTTHSGRRFVLALIFVLGSFAIALFVAFRQWKSRHEELATYGAVRVATALEPLAKKVPPGSDPAEWAVIVDQGRRVIVGLTASGSMDLAQMRRLRAELQEAVIAARPETAAQTLESLWDDLERRAGPGLTRAPRFELASAVRAFANLEPPGVAADQWRLAVLRTRAMLVALMQDDLLPSTRRRPLRDEIEGIAARASTTTARADLDEIWTRAAKHRPLPSAVKRPGMSLPPTP